MSQEYVVAAVQMDATPGSVAERLTRAGLLIRRAAQAGARLIVLPQMFNTGYGYFDELYERTENMDDSTVAWLRDQSIRNNVYIAGSLVLLDINQAYHAALLVSPDGQIWRYDQQFPFLWERAFYREGHRLMVAQTQLGKIGILLGWDIGHRALWHRYAGLVDMLLVMSAAPDMSQANLLLPTGEKQSIARVGAAFTDYGGASVNAQAAWMGVPVINAAASGQIDTLLPAPRFSVTAFLLNRPDWQQYLPYAPETRLLAPLHQHTRIIDARGQTRVNAEVEGDDVIVTTLTLPDEPPCPMFMHDQPALTVPNVVYPLFDGIWAGGMSLIYQRGLRRQWGARMAPMDFHTKLWAGAVGGAFAAGVILTSLWYASSDDAEH